MQASSKFSVLPFSAENFCKELVSTPCIADDIAANRRVSYLSSYLAQINSVTIVSEHEYVDADYLDDFASFYAKSFDEIPNRCRRLHFFSIVLDVEEFRSALIDAEKAKALKDAYLGFIVARPLPTAVIGRTVLNTYPSDNGRRNYTALRRYEVNLFGIQLSVESLAFQEQDTSLAACATVALWSCFQKTQDLFCSLAPSPVAITRAANRLLLAARPFPSRGLQIQQICNAIAAVGLDPEIYEVTPDLPLASLVYSYLKLGLPVIAVVDVEGLGLHAIALTGFSLKDDVQLSSEGANVLLSLPRLIGSRIDEFYGHDDQNGPFCRLKIAPPDAANSTLTFSSTGWTQTLRPKTIVIPVYPKIRTGFRDAIKWLPHISIVAGWASSPQDFEWDIQLTSGNEFKNQVHSGTIVVTNSHRESLLIDGLPKYLWRCTLTSGYKPIFEMLLDTTAMVNGFPVKRLWWIDESIKQAVDQILNNSQFEVTVSGLLGSRLLTMLRNA